MIIHYNLLGFSYRLGSISNIDLAGNQVADTADILIIDDDNGIRELLSRTLSREGYRVFSAKDAVEALEILNKEPLDLIVCDVLMPGKSGIQLVKELKENPVWPYEIPILMLTALNESDDRVRGLEAGADDYLAKPFDPRELKLRIKNLLARRAPQVEDNTNQYFTRFGPFVFNSNPKELRRDDEHIYLSHGELELLQLFVENLNKPVSRETLSIKLNHISERSVDVQVNRLRRKIEIDPKKPVYLQTAWGQGYILKDIML